MQNIYTVSNIYSVTYIHTAVMYICIYIYHAYACLVHRHVWSVLPLTDGAYTLNLCFYVQGLCAAYSLSFGAYAPEFVFSM